MAVQARKISAIFVIVLASCSCIGSVQEERTADIVDRLLQLLREKKDESLTVKHEEVNLRELDPETVPVQQITDTDTENTAGEDEEEIEVRGSDPCSGRGVTLTASTGTISTPGYGTHRYPNRRKCTWKIISQDTRSKIKLVFKTPFSIETGPRCRYDSISVFDGSGSRARNVGKYCNSNPPPVTIIRNINIVTLQFVSDSSTTGLGFTLQYTIIPGPAPQVPDKTRDECSGTHARVLEGERGTVTSRNYPKAYGKGLNCNWIIRVPTGKKIRLDIEDFGLEADLLCEYDSLSVYDGKSPNDGLIGKYCGTRVPKDITTTGNEALLRFKSDDSVSKKGFKITFTAIGGPAPSPPTTTRPGKPGKPEPTVTPSPTQTPSPTPMPSPTPPSRPRVDLNCTFEDGNMCMWTAGAGGNINWKLKQAKFNTFTISNGERWGSKDHTTDNSNGHYIVIDGNERVSVSNARGFLVTPLLSAGSEEGRCLHLWYNMYYTKGVLQVVMRREDENDEVIWQRDGFQGNGWHQGRISLVSSTPYRILLVGTRGTKEKETGIAVDDISFLNTPCLSIALDCGQRHDSITKRSLLDELLDPDTKTSLLPAPAEEELSRRILGGQASSVGTWPWVVNIRTTPPGGGTYMACGGSLIDQQWVLTAAHCFENNKQWLTNVTNIQLRLGEANVGRTGWEDSQINIRPLKVIIHPQRSKKSMGQVAPYDLALVKLPHRVTLNEQINVVCLPPAGRAFRPRTNCVVTGWGVTEDGTIQGSEQLLHVDLELLSTSLCRGYFGSSIGNDVICAKHRRDVKAACKGDSGGPLVCRSGNHYILAGVVSWGVPCARHEQPLPSVFARVTYFLPWIESTINSEQ